MWLVTEMDPFLSTATKPTPIGLRLGEQVQNATGNQIAARTESWGSDSGAVGC